ncbi:GNAT family N-acetyltransferase [Parasphingorhabdus litoris]|uniref:GNAT family N-acetyltransferase n=1 Tax=Parasphingorhabdus litoris TaxID=394733 RepID=A0ABP3K288_9SPHN|nr:GNAT family N-acetyltransferase [Parasphingorhabdus litoris]
MSTIEIPPDSLGVIVTYFEMMQKPPAKEKQSDLVFRSWDHPDPASYKSLFHRIGEEWLWFGRLLMSDTELKAILHDEATEIISVQHGDNIVGFAELDFSESQQCEIVYFGLVPEMNGKGYGNALMAETLKRAWKDDINRVWLHTCTNDSQRATGFYKREGFTAYKREIDIHPDPRITGHLSMDAGPHVPIIKGPN